MYNILFYLQKSYSLADYLSDVKNCNIRANISKLRIGDIKLNYYAGLRFNKSRTCEMCDSNVDETTEHFLLQCVKYEISRQKFTNRLNVLNIDFNSMESVDDKIAFILNVDSRAVNEICSYISEICKIRNFS